MIAEGPPKDRPEGAPPVGVTVVHAEHARIGVITKYWSPGAYTPPAVEGGPPDPPAIDQWCIELDTGDVLLWQPDSVSVLNPDDFVLLGVIAGGTEALFKGVFARARKNGVPFGRTLELLGLVMQAQLAAIGRAVDAEATKRPDA